MIDLQTVLTYLTLISVPVGVFYHIMTLRNTKRNQELQLETRHVQLFWNIYNELQGEEGESRMHFVTNLDYSDYDDFMEKYGRDNNIEAWNKITSFVTFLEGLGVLVRDGFVDIRHVAMLMSGDIMLSWEKMRPWLHASRERYDWPRFGIETEYLYNSVVDYATKHPELQIKLPTYNQ